MDQYSLGDEGALPSEMHLPSFSESQGLNCSDTLNRDLGPSTRDLLYAGLSGLDLDSSLPTPEVPNEVLEDNLDALSLYSGKDSDSMKLLEEYADPESQTSLQDLGLGALKVPKEADDGGRAASGSARKGKRQHASPQSALLDCSLCGKVFSSASSLSKHYLTHSQERKHVCKVCSKAFKRQDHLTGHMLTHQKTKPFVCIQQGCSKSYCDYRSLRRHHEVQHGLCILREAPVDDDACGEPPHAHEVPGGPRALAPPEARSPSSLLPNRDLLRCIVSSIVHQKVPSPGPTPAGPSDGEGRSTACPCPPSSGSCTPMAPAALGVEVSEDPRPPRKEPVPDTFVTVHSRAAENSGPEPAEPEPPLLQLPSTLEGWPEAGPLPACLPLFRGQTVPASSQPPSHSFQWLRNLPGCPKSKGNNVFVVHKPPAAPCREGPESGSGPSSASPLGEPSPGSGPSLEDNLPFPLPLPKVPGEALGEPRHAGGEDDPWASKKSRFDCEAFPRQSPREPGLQDGQKPGGLPSDATPLLRQLFLKPQEPLMSPEQMQVFQMFAKPQRAFSHAQVAQMFYTEKGLGSHMCFHSDQWPSPRTKQEQVFGTEFCKPLRQAPRPDGDGQSPPGAKKSLDSPAAAPLEVSVSVPVAPAHRPLGSTAKGQEKDMEERDSKESSQHRKRKKRPQPKALFAPPAPSAFGDPGPGRGHQSCLRSPVFLVDRLLKGLFQCPPYTPPPMLSPIREGSGLYFSTLCCTVAQVGPDRLTSTMLDQVDGSFGICVVKDDTKISIEPHINIGSRFQAEIPELQQRSLAGTDEHVASLAWKPWGDVMSNPETQDRVTELCNVACSSAMPGGGTNLELALHCLHEAQGDVQVALETLLLRGPQKPQTHPLADYRYTGSDIWTPMEKRLFKKAFCAHKKDFYLIHKTIQTKTVAQCVEYYYIWKKMIKFDCGRAPGLEKRLKREAEDADRTDAKVTCSPRETPSHHPTPELKIRTKGYRRESVRTTSPSTGPRRTPEPPGSAEGRGVFPCRECERVFDKIKSRNAHMKRHRLQDHVGPVVRVRWPAKPFQLEEEEEDIGADVGPLHW
uniref:Zinc finger protein 541 n=1 Tax=Rousettus aegyptiacus TaxID=9407 RepID=A0A7J8CNS2_ROUAE|nr:zinc finger protein 541 [Rousettus aegyptiacus]